MRWQAGCPDHSRRAGARGWTAPIALDHSSIHRMCPPACPLDRVVPVSLTYSLTGSNPSGCTLKSRFLALKRQWLDSPGVRGTIQIHPKANQRVSFVRGNKTCCPGNLDPKDWARLGLAFHSSPTLAATELRRNWASSVDCAGPIVSATSRDAHLSRSARQSSSDGQRAIAASRATALG